MVSCQYLGIIVAVSAVIFSAQAVIISSPVVTDWGVWGSFSRCPNGTLARVIQLKTHAYAGNLVDDTALNAIKFYCGDHWDINTPQITSTEGTKGTWGNHFPCGGDGYVVGFQLKVEKRNALTDNTATNNVKIFCSNHQNGNYIIGDGERFGDWGATVSCPAGHGVCGIQTQVQAFSSLVDSTALNNINLDCCPVLTSPMNKFGNNKRKRFLA